MGSDHPKRAAGRSRLSPGQCPLRHRDVGDLAASIAAVGCWNRLLWRLMATGSGSSLAIAVPRRRMQLGLDRCLCRA